MASCQTDHPPTGAPDALAFARALACAAGYGDDVARYIIDRALGGLPPAGGTA